ncbi:MAG: hypothetical protein U0263_08060 [Polyangiaceae bacterium]
MRFCTSERWSGVAVPETRSSSSFLTWARAASRAASKAWVPLDIAVGFGPAAVG